MDDRHDKKITLTQFNELSARMQKLISEGILEPVMLLRYIDRPNPRERHHDAHVGMLYQQDHPGIGFKEPLLGAWIDDYTSSLTLPTGSHLVLDNFQSYAESPARYERKHIEAVNFQFTEHPRHISFADLSDLVVPTSVQQIVLERNNDKSYLLIGRQRIDMLAESGNDQHLLLHQATTGLFPQWSSGKYETEKYEFGQPPRSITQQLDVPLAMRLLEQGRL